MPPSPCGTKANDLRMKVQVLRGPDGKVIFVECGSDFVELMFKIMKAPLSSVLALPMKRKRGEDHPLMTMHSSLADLDKQSFVQGELPNDVLAKAIDIQELFKATAPSFPPQGYQAMANGNLSCQSCQNQFQPGQYPNYLTSCPFCHIDPSSNGRRALGYGSVRCQSCGQNFQPRQYPHEQQCPTCKPSPKPTILKDNCKFMLTDALKVFDASTVKAMELMKNNVGGFRDIKTSTATVTEECIKKLIVQSLLGSKTVFTDLFPAA